MSWLYYLLEANLYLLVFFAFYLLVLRSETFYNRNRFYLIGSSVLAFIIPLLQLGFLKPRAIVEQVTYTVQADYTPNIATQAIITPPETTLALSDFILPIYLLIALVLVVKLCFAIFKIISIYKKASKYKAGHATVIELNGDHTAFSFLNMLFINPLLPKRDLIFTHEMIHIEQKHSWDVLFFELLQIVNWFNPIIYFIKKEVKVLHEYIADELATSNTNTKHEYAMVLIENSLQFKPHALANQFFNQSILKRRLKMLNKEKTKSWAKIKLLLALPLVGGMLCLSTMAFTKDYGYDLLPQKVDLQDTTAKVMDEIEMAKTGRYSPSYVYDKNNQYKSLEKRLIVINSVPIKENDKYYGNTKADKIIFLKPEQGIEKYGTKGKYGAVEIFGENLEFHRKYVISDTLNYPRPIIKKGTVKKVSSPTSAKTDQIKFPPPIVKQDHVKFPVGKSNNSFFPSNEYRAQKPVKIDLRLIVINDKIISDNSTFYGVTNATYITHIAKDLAVKRYGEKGKYGAVEIYGKNLEYYNKPVPQSIIKKDNVKFPPPIVKPDKKQQETKNLDTQEQPINNAIKKSLDAGTSAEIQMGGLTIIYLPTNIIEGKAGEYMKFAMKKGGKINVEVRSPNNKILYKNNDYKLDLYAINQLGAKQNNMVLYRKNGLYVDKKP